MSKFLSILGLCKRAGKLSSGFDATINSVKEKKATLIVIADDISAKSEKNIRFEAEKFNIKVIKSTHTIADISHAIGKKAGIVAILDENFASGLVKAETGV